jgi:sarcosine oxidase/L-pipecolate oxidase
MVCISLLPRFSEQKFRYIRIFGTDGEATCNRALNFDMAGANTRKFGEISQIVDFPTWDSVVASFPVLAHPSHSESKTGFRGMFNGNAGWVKPMDAMVVLKRECESYGVKFESGANGTVVELLRADDGITVVGVKTEDGKEWTAEKIILATGSYSDTLLDFQGQLVAVSSARCPYSSFVLT